MRVLAAGLALIAVLCLFAAIADMVIGRLKPLAAGLLRAAALLLFVTAVVLNAVSR
jgi:hypothetical protein